MSSSFNTMSEAKNEQLQVLLRQERTSYKTHEYLERLQQQQRQERSAQLLSPNDIDGLSVASSQAVIDQCWRERICEWAYQVVDHFDLKREIVGIAMNYMDRYLANSPTVNRRMFQLLAMTCVYMAIKLHHSGVLLISGSASTMESILRLSRGFFSMEEMKLMEYSILQSLQWHVHPPTPQDFVRIYLWEEQDASQMEVAQFLIELAVMDCFFISYSSSQIATAAVVLVMMNQSYSTTRDKLPPSSDSFDYASSAVQACCERLSQIYARVHEDTDDRTRDASGAATSPVSVRLQR